MGEKRFEMTCFFGPGSKNWRGDEVEYKFRFNEHGNEVDKI